MFQDIKYIFKRCGWLMLLFLVLMYVSVMNYIQPYLVVVFSAFALLYVFRKKYINWEVVILGCFSVLYCLMLFLDNNIKSGFNFISYLISPFVFYCFGSFVVDKLKHPRLITIFLLLITLMFALNLYISVVLNINENGLICISRKLKVIGVYVNNKAGTLAATLYGLNVSLGFVGLAIFVYYRKTLNVGVRILFLTLSVFSLITVIHLVNRTGLVLLVLCFVAVTFYNMRRSFWRVLGVLVIGAIVVYFVYSFGWVGEEVLQAYEDREIEGHSIAESGGRTARWIDAIKLLFEYPWGYSDLRGVTVHYAHNLWLDVGRVAGVLPFVVLLIAAILYGINFLKLLSRNDGFLCSIFLAYNVVFFLSCMVEPILEGMPLYFYLYVMLWGMQRQYLKIRENIDKLYLRNNI